MDDKPRADEALTEPSITIKLISLGSQEKITSTLSDDTAGGRGWHRHGKTWQLLLWVGDARKPRNPCSRQERGWVTSLLSGQETELIAKLKITESLPVHPSLDTGGLNRYGHTGLQVKWKDFKCPRLQVWGAFAPLKSISLISTSSLISLVWDHHRRGIFSFGQMHIDHFQKRFLSYRTDIQHLSVVPCSSQRSHAVLGTTQTNRLKGKQAV